MEKPGEMIREKKADPISFTQYFVRPRSDVKREIKIRGFS